MIPAAIASVLLIALVIVAARTFSAKRPSSADPDTHTDIPTQLIHSSGIYSILRSSPREDLARIRPSRDEIIKYLASINEDSTGKQLSENDKMKLVEEWTRAVEDHLALIERGDADGSAFYLYDFKDGHLCKRCSSVIESSMVVSREELFKHPVAIPPFHLGCTVMLKNHGGKDTLHDTRSINTTSLFANKPSPEFPNWQETIVH